MMIRSRQAKRSQKLIPLKELSLYLKRRLYPAGEFRHELRRFCFADCGTAMVQQKRDI